MKAQRHSTARAPRPEAGPRSAAMPNGGPSVLPRTRSAEVRRSAHEVKEMATPSALAKGLTATPSSADSPGLSSLPSSPFLCLLSFCLRVRSPDHSKFPPDGKTAKRERGKSGSRA